METFIHQQYLSDISICDQLIETFESSNEKRKGRIGAGVIDPSTKDSVDLTFEQVNKVVLHQYYFLLREVVRSYVYKFPACNSYCPWEDVTGQIQYYPPGGGFKLFHTERCARHLPTAYRHLVFMTYLNDVNDGGGTEFLHQNLIVQPKKGLTLIWPTDWTHTHRGIVSPTQEKYIITGWFSFSA